MEIKRATAASRSPGLILLLSIAPIAIWTHGQHKRLSAALEATQKELHGMKETVLKLHASVAAYPAGPRNVTTIHASTHRRQPLPFTARPAAGPAARGGKHNGEKLVTWYCPSLGAAGKTEAAPLPAFIVYALRNNGAASAVSMFRDLRSEAEVGDGYVVMHESQAAGPTRWLGPLGSRKCAPLLYSDHPQLPFQSGHYSAASTVVKIDL